MDSLKAKKFNVLKEEELNLIEGGGLWNKWKSDANAEGTICWQERHNWFGLHATGELRDVQVDV